MSENAIGYLLNRAGYHGHHVPHGFRAAFSTIMNELAEREGKKHDRMIIDIMLAHVPKDRVEGAYNRAAYMPRRRELAQIRARPADVAAVVAFLAESDERWVTGQVLIRCHDTGRSNESQRKAKHEEALAPSANCGRGDSGPR